MSEAATLLSQLAGVTLVAVLLSSMLSSALYRPVRRLVSAFGPRTRAAATLSYALITPGVALIAIGLNSGSGAAHWPLIEHCHGDQCGNHAPLLAAEPRIIGQATDAKPRQALVQATADLATARLQVHEKTAWMLRSLLD